MRPGIFVSCTREKLGRTCDQIGRTLEPWLYSMLKVSNVSLNMIMCEVYSHSERTIDILPQILKIN